MPAPELTNDLAPASDDHVADVAAAAKLYGAWLIQTADALEHMPPKIREDVTRMLERILSSGKDPDTRTRLALLSTVDMIVGEATVGTGLADPFRRHFPGLGNADELAVLADPRCAALRAFAVDWARCLWSGSQADFLPHTTPALWRTLTELSDPLPPPRLDSRPGTGEPWLLTKDQAAFAVAAVFLVSHPARAAQLLHAMPKLVTAIEAWRPGERGRWEVCRELVAEIGVRVSGETLRAQWQEHVHHRARPGTLVEVFHNT